MFIHIFMVPDDYLSSSNEHGVYGCSEHSTPSNYTAITYCLLEGAGHSDI